MHFLFYCFLASFLKKHTMYNYTVDTNNTFVSTNDILKTLVIIDPIFQF